MELSSDLDHCKNGPSVGERVQTEYGIRNVASLGDSLKNSRFVRGLCGGGGRDVPSETGGVTGFHFFRLSLHQPSPDIPTCQTCLAVTVLKRHQACKQLVLSILWYNDSSACTENNPLLSSNHGTQYPQHPAEMRTPGILSARAGCTIGTS